MKFVSLGILLGKSLIIHYEKTRRITAVRKELFVG